MKNPERLTDYARSLGSFSAQLPRAVSYPAVALLGVRDNSTGTPRGIEAHFVQFVATARERRPEGGWPQPPVAAQSLRYDGNRLIVVTTDAEYGLVVDRNCPVSLTSCTVLPADFEGIADADLLAAYLATHPHTEARLSLEMHVPQMNIDRPRASTTVTTGRQRPLYERPSTAKSVAWFAVGVLLIYLGARWLGMGMAHGVVVNFYGWGIIVLGAVLVVRRGLDLIFPPSRL